MSVIRVALLASALIALPAGAARAAPPQAQAVVAPAPAALDAYISYPYVSDLVASGDRIAWFEYRRGRRNVFVAQSPDYKPRQVTATTADDGQELTNLSFSPDGRTIAWVRGGDHHRNPWAANEPAPNPASAATKPEMEIWVAGSDGSNPRMVALGDAPAFGSDGRLAYLKGGQVWVVDTSGAPEPHQLFYDRGRIDDLTWSPDGRRLAFVSRRGSHSFVGVFSDERTPITWMSPATGFDGDPAWSPDGSRIAFTRRSGVTMGVAPILGEQPNPFAILVADVATGTARQAWESPRTLNGSYPGLGANLLWGAGDTLVFRAELENWANLYALPASGGALRPLTPGSFMVEDIALSPDRRTIFYSANSGVDADDIERRHLFSVAVAGGAPKAVTQGTDLEWRPTPMPNGIAWIGAGPTRPTGIVVANTSGSRPRAITDTSYAPGPLVTPKHVTYAAPDGTTIHGQLFMPTGGAAKKPGIVFVHGGPSRQMLLGFTYMDYYTHAYAMNQYLASRGYVVLSINYRLGIGYGRAFQRPAKAGIAGASEYQDVLAAGHYLQKLPQVDPAKIGIWGGSYGGYLTAMALGRNSDVFKAGVDLHGVHDYSFYPSRIPTPQRYERGDYEAAMKSAFESSPMAFLDTWKSPVLLVHGDADGNVRFDQTPDLARRLEARGIPYEVLILPNEVHGFLRHDSWLKSDTATINFFDKALKK